MVVDCATFSVETTCDPVSSSDFTKVMVARFSLCQMLYLQTMVSLDWIEVLFREKMDGWLILYKYITIVVKQSI